MQVSVVVSLVRVGLSGGRSDNSSVLAIVAKKKRL